MSGLRDAFALLWPRRGERLLPALSAVLLTLCFPPLHLLVLPFVALVPLALFVDGLPGAEGRRAAVRGSLLFGVLHFGLLFYWIPIALAGFTWLAIPAYVGTVALLGGTAAGFGWLLHRSLHDLRVPLWAALPVLWTATEWFRAHWPGPFALPWLGLGTTLTGFPELVGIAEVVGAQGVGLWIAAANGLLASLLLQRGGRGRRLRLAVPLLLLLGAPPAWGVWRARTLELREVATVAVVQPNVPASDALGGPRALDAVLASLDTLLGGLPAGAADLVVLPEGVFPLYPGSGRGGPAMARMETYARDLGAPVLFGALGHRGTLGADWIPYNSAFLMQPDGLADFRYDKRHLVPMVERVPWLPSSWLRRVPSLGAFGVGRGWPLAQVGGVRYGVLICYESSYPDAARRFRREGADVLVNLTNDRWFGGEAWHARTAALWQHPAHLVMRAIESRVGIVRAAATGFSFLVDPIGRVSHRTALFEPDARLGVVTTSDVRTLHARWGDRAGDASALGALVLLVGALSAARRPRSLDPNRARD